MGELGGTKGILPPFSQIIGGAWPPLPPPPPLPTPMKHIQKDADRIVNSVDPDQTYLSALFTKTFLSQYLESYGACIFAVSQKKNPFSTTKWT